MWLAWVCLAVGVTIFPYAVWQLRGRQRLLGWSAAVGVIFLAGVPMALRQCSPDEPAHLAEAPPPARPEVSALNAPITTAPVVSSVRPPVVEPFPEPKPVVTEPQNQNLRPLAIQPEVQPEKKPELSPAELAAQAKYNRKKKEFPAPLPIDLPELGLRIITAKALWERKELKRHFETLHIRAEKYSDISWLVATAMAGDHLTGSYKAERDFVNGAEEDFDSFIFFAYKMGESPAEHWIPSDTFMDLWILHRQIVLTASSYPFKDGGMAIRPEAAREEREFYFDRFGIVPETQNRVAKDELLSRLRLWKR